MSQTRVPEGARKYKEESGPGAPQKLQHHPHPSQQHPSQGLPPPAHHQHQHQHQQHHTQHHPRPVSSLQHPPHPDSPHQNQPNQSPAQAHYSSPHPANSAVPQQHPSPYVQQVQGAGGQTQQEVPYYTTHASPYTNNNAPNAYSAAEPDQMMAAAIPRGAGAYNAHMYHGGHQSNPSAPVQSPQHDPHGRPPSIYGAGGQMPNSQQIPNPGMYYSTPYPAAGPSPYPPNPPQQQMFTQQQAQQPQHLHQPHTPGLRDDSSPKSRGPQTSVPRPQSNLPGPPQTPTQGPPGGAPAMHPGAPVPGGAANMNPNAAPGPIPATTPLVVRQDNNGVQWIAFEYSRDRVKMEYTIRCDVESVNVDSLSDSFKTDNCVYPRACCPKDQYKGNRLAYETECNTVGWALAELNPCLRGKRGLIQRAVDSWRNSNQDPRLRSRRVRRQAKLTARKAQQGHPSPMAGPGAPPGVPHAAAMASAPRPPNMGMGAPPMHHPHDHHGAHPGNEDVSDAYSNATHHHQPPPAPKPSVNGEHRPAHNVYPDFPTNHTQPQVNGMPHINNPSAPLPGAPPSQAEARAARLAQDEQDRRSHLFGALAPDVLKRRFIVVKDEQKNNQNSRIHCSLGEVQLQEIPDSFRKVNCLYPRSYFDMQMSSPPQSPTGSGHFQNDEPDRPNKPQCPLGGQTLVRVSTPERPVEVPVPRLTKAARTREIDINELGYRMTWAQSRMFSHRQLFLQRSMDHYRNMMESQTAKKEGHDVPPHFQTRRGKKWWPQRRSRNRRGSD